jgi:DNA-binding response OmpR family regulator
MVALGASESFNAAREVSPDLILCDLSKSEVDAFDLRRRLLRNPALARVPFIFISATRTQDAQLEALRLGAADYLLKPLNSDTLNSRLVHFLESRNVRAPIDAALSGPLDLIPCPSLLQCLDWNKSTGILHIRGKTQSGHFVFKEGAVVDARVGELAGEDAAFELIAIDEGDFVFDAKPASTLTDIRRFKVQALLMESSWIKDELESLGENAPEASDLIEVSEPKLASDCFTHPAWGAFVSSGIPRSAAAIAKLLGLGVKRARVGLGEGVRSGALRVAGQVGSETLMVLRSRIEEGVRPKRTIGGGARVLVIDDDRECCAMLAPFLEAAGFEVHARHTGLEALEAVAQVSPEIVVLEGLLPGMLGPQVCQAIRKSEHHPFVPVILFSSYFRDPTAHRYLREECGVNLILHKPCDARVVLEQVIAVFDKTRTDGGAPKTLQDLCERVRAYDKGLAILHERYRDRLPDRIESLRHALDRFAHADRHPLFEETHRLRASAGIYGYAEASELLSRLEAEAGSENGAVDMSALKDILAAIEIAFRTSSSADVVTPEGPTTNPTGAPPGMQQPMPISATVTPAIR